VIQETLNDREAKYGDFNKLAAAIQAFKNVYRASPSWKHMTAVQRETFDMMAVKKCRILYGDNMHADSWADLCGYAMLAHEEFARPDLTMAPPAEPQHPMDLDGPMPTFLTEG
jgi:hypothetical protein